MRILAVIMLLFSTPILCFAGIKHQINDDVGVEFSFLGQVWYQHATNMKLSTQERDLNDFLIRRAYFILKGNFGKKTNWFVIYAGDRLGQEGLNDNSNGVGSGLALREAWVSYSFDPAFQVQAGRMYVPFTRNFGTTAPLTMMAVDMNFTQGGVRGNIFYPSRVARDDGLVLWGNPADGLVQYRLMISDGVEDESRTGDPLRVAGRLALNLGKDREKTWTNKGTYLGEKKVLAVAVGFDQQQDLVSGDYSAWTLDFFMDQPLGSGSITAESGYIQIDNAPIALSFTELAPGDDAQIFYVTAGYLYKQFQPYFRVEHLSVDDGGDTTYPAFGVNYFFKGHEQKITVDVTQVNSDNVPDHTFVTVQYTFAF